jgi:hypothetical protein
MTGEEFSGPWPYSLFAVVLGTTKNGSPIFGRYQGERRRCAYCYRVSVDGWRRVWLGEPFRDLGLLCGDCWQKAADAADGSEPEGELGSAAPLGP